MQQPSHHYVARELPWHAFQRLLAEELRDQARQSQQELPLHSWLARALASASVTAHRC